MQVRPMFAPAAALALLALAAPVPGAPNGDGDPVALVERAESLIQSDPERAGELVAEALPLVQGVEYAEARATAFLVDAQLLENLDKVDEARQRCEDDLVVARRERLAETHAIGLALGSRLARKLGEPREALELLRELERLPAHVRSPESLADLARLAAELGQPELCLEHAATASRAFRGRGDWRSAAELEQLLGRSLLELGDVAHARSILLEVAGVYELEVSPFDARPADESTLHLLLAKAARLQGDTTAAAHHLEVAGELALALERPEVDEHLARERAELALFERRFEDALDELGPLLTKLERRAPEHVARMRSLEGRTLHAAGRTAEAQALEAAIDRGLTSMPWRDERGALAPLG